MSSKLLIDNIKRYDALSHFKLINVEQYIASGIQIPQQINVVPALMFKETKAIIFGKQVFDYLLLPNKGFLLNLAKKGETEQPVVSGGGAGAVVEEPSSFNLHSGVGCGDNFGFIDDSVGDVQKSYLWSGLDEKFHIPTPEDTTNNMEKEKNSKKKMPDIALLRSQRELDLQQSLPAVASAVPIV